MFTSIFSNWLEWRLRTFSSYLLKMFSEWNVEQKRRRRFCGFVRVQKVITLHAWVATRVFTSLCFQQHLQSAFFSFLRSNLHVFTNTNMYSGRIWGRSWPIRWRFPQCVIRSLQRWLSRFPSSPNFEWQQQQWNLAWKINFKWKKHAKRWIHHICTSSLFCTNRLHAYF